MQRTGPYLSILIPDGENELLTNHVKDCLAKVPRVRLYIMSSTKNGPSRYSRFVHHYSYYPLAATDLQWVDNINTEMQRHDIDIILPVYEDCIRLLIKFKDQLKEHAKLVPLSSLKMFTIANNKALLAEHLEKNNIPGPISRLITAEGILEFCEGDFPLLVKPINQSDGGSGIILIRHKNELPDFLETHQDIGNLLFQKFINGYDIDCSVLCYKGEIKAFTIQKGILYGQRKYAPPIGICFLYEKEIHKTIE